MHEAPSSAQETEDGQQMVTHLQLTWYFSDSETCPLSSAEHLANTSYNFRS
jgi:hypothetical protein